VFMRGVVDNSDQFGLVVSFGVFLSGMPGLVFGAIVGSIARRKK